MAVPTSCESRISNASLLHSMLKRQVTGPLNRGIMPRDTESFNLSPYQGRFCAAEHIRLPACGTMHD